MFNKMSHFQQRLVMGTLAILFIFGSITFSFDPFFRPIFILLTALFVGLGVWELCQLAKNLGYQPLTALATISTVLYVISSSFPFSYMLRELVLLIVVVVSFLYYFVRGTSPFINISITIFCFAYLAVPLAYLLNINYYFPKDTPLPSPQDGRLWLAYLLTVTKLTDMGAYFAGKTFGKHKCTPYISPNKTWEGAIGGTLAGIVASTLFCLTPLHLSLQSSLVLGLLLTITAQFGDLAESLLKRDAQIKDSNSLPGLGGALDILDSLVFTTPLLYIYLKIQGA